MATEAEVQAAEKRRNDLPKLEAALATLELQVAVIADYEILIKRGGETFSLTALLNSLETADQAEIAGMMATINGAIDTLIGPDDITASTLRKAIKDVYDNYAADIAAT